jgi:hypothetical protein
VVTAGFDSVFVSAFDSLFVSAVDAVLLSAVFDSDDAVSCLPSDFAAGAEEPLA